MGCSIILLDRKNFFILFCEGVVVHIGSLLSFDFFPQVQKMMMSRDMGSFVIII
jgi:hypothetical protein